ncbi:MAG: fructose-bisphosphatase class II [Nannocystaceae bacterium]|nr:fructose-bisphosphatase class II [Nannocystaceae bacterium]
MGSRLASSEAPNTRLPTSFARAAIWSPLDLVFVATGATTGPLLKGVRREGNRLHMQTLAMRSNTGTVRYTESSVRADRFDAHT